MDTCPAGLEVGDALRNHCMVCGCYCVISSLWQKIRQLEAELNRLKR